MTDKSKYIPGLTRKSETIETKDGELVKKSVEVETHLTDIPIEQQQTITQTVAHDIKVVDTKMIVETVPETHFETKYVTKTIPVSVPVQTEHTVVTGVQETKQIPVTRFVERIETVPIKRVEQVTEYQTVPVTKLEEVVENIPVKKIVAHTEYQKIPVTKLVERIENVQVKRVEAVTEYETVTVNVPVKPTDVENFKETSSVTGVINASQISANVNKEIL
jgi:hypothetical protein